MQRFVYQEGSSNKFWAVLRDGNKLIVHYGKVGTSGREEEKLFSTDAAAEAEMKKLIEQKLKKGYVVDGEPPECVSGQAEPTVQKSVGAEKTPAAKTADESSKLGASLRKLQKAIAALKPADHVILKPPAAVGQISQFSEFLDGKPLPEDLQEWFRCHNGQPETSVLVPGENRRLLSIDESLETCKFFADPDEEFEQPWHRSWIPIADNGAGDYVIYESEGAKAGQLINYYHDDDKRPIESKSLTAWIERACKEIKAYAKKPSASVPKFDLSQLSKLSWSEIEMAWDQDGLDVGAQYRARRNQMLPVTAEDPIGTVYRKSNNDKLSNDRFRCHLFIKIGSNEWLATNGPNVESLYDSGSGGWLHQQFNNGKSLKALVKGGYAKTNENVASELSIYSCTQGEVGKSFLTPL